MKSRRMLVECNEGRKRFVEDSSGKNDRKSLGEKDPIFSFIHPFVISKLPVDSIRLNKKVMEVVGAGEGQVLIINTRFTLQNN